MVRNILGMVAGGYAVDRIVESYPDLTPTDVEAALEYAASMPAGDWAYKGSADQDVLDLIKSRMREQEVLDMLDEPSTFNVGEDRDRAGASKVREQRGN